MHTIASIDDQFTVTQDSTRGSEDRREKAKTANPTKRETSPSLL